MSNKKEETSTPRQLTILDIANLYAEKELRKSTFGMSPATANAVRDVHIENFRMKGLVLILAELSDELLKLAGDGHLRLKGQQRLLDALGIPRDKAE